ncbi:mucin-associated surface protein [Arthrobacter sp. CG_A4]|uniref:mucin-associated surface protein n=1 Tax=Arthrobacter sp. CG_A4 TaxID=3071706 RepID=UPI002E09B312|nr:hypothetical protein [Arthrobacter sp. CG_A4]
MTRISAPRGNGTRTGQAAAKLAGCLLGTALLTGTLAGCGTPAPELGRDAAQQLQSQVFAVTEAAAANDPAGSLRLLDGLVERLDAAAASGDVSFKRHQSIRASIDAVRADLTAQQAAAEAARVTAEQEAAAQAAAAAAAASAATPAPVAPEPVPVDNGKAKGKGQDRDKSDD